MRKVQYFEHVLEDTGEGAYKKKIAVAKFKGNALFHQFGMDYEEFETGAGNYSTAIIELEDGTVKNIPADMIKFI